MEALLRQVRGLKLPVSQFQDFTPTPGTLSTAMHITGLGRDSRRPIYVPRGNRERRAQRQVLETLRDGEGHR